MDPLTAFSLAAGIIQVVQFSATLLSNSSQILEAGSTKQNVQTEITTDDFKILLDTIKLCASDNQEDKVSLLEVDVAIFWLIGTGIRTPSSREHTYSGRTARTAYERPSLPGHH